MPTRVMDKSGVEGVGTDSRDQRFFVGTKVVSEDAITEEAQVKKNSSFKKVSCSDESSSSSLGVNSDLSEEKSGGGGDGEEVQSSYKGPLDAMEALEQVLPIRRGISRFYNGKSKSFASLADAASSSSSSSIKDIAKPENAYMRKRRNLLASNLAWDKTRFSPLRGNAGGGISKRVTGSTRTTTLAMAVAVSNSESNKKELGYVSSRRMDFLPWRSFSLADLQQCAVTCSNSSELSAKPS